MVKTTKVFRHLQNNTKDIIAFQGSTRASKTYNILMWLIYKAKDWDGKYISIVRQTLPSLKSSAERDFFEILNNLGLYNPANHNKTDRIYELGGNFYEFFSCDQEIKVRGRKRNILFVNEANQLDFDTWTQLILRTSDLVILDYNPSNQFHWIYDDVLTRANCQFHKITYKDNPFLEPRIIKEIESLRDTNENLWRIYGLGERGISTDTIFTHHKTVPKFPEVKGRAVYGLDFGFNHPSSLIEVAAQDEAFFVRELLYQDKLTSAELTAKIKKVIAKNHIIYADYSRPEVIREMQRAGINVINAKKDVLPGIDFINSNQIFITQDSTNLLEELKGYSWKKNRAGVRLDEPIKFKDDAIDAMRYALFTHFRNDNKFSSSISLK